MSKKTKVVIVIILSIISMGRIGCWYFLPKQLGRKLIALIFNVKVAL
jgi:hypothetical protein